MEFPEIKKTDEFTGVKKEVETVTLKTKGLRKVTDDTSLSVAAEVLTEVDWVLKRADNQRLEAGRPYRDHADSMTVEFNELVSPLKGVHARLQEDIDAYQEEKQAEVEAERQRLQKLADKRQEREDRKAERQGREPIVHAPPEIPDADVTIKTSGGSIQPKKIRKYKVVDFSKLPERFKQENKGELNKAAKGGEDDIPGLEFYYDRSNAISH